MTSAQESKGNKKKKKGDGSSYININGETELGQLLAHFAHTPFTHPYFGPFNSMEGFWHYIKTKEKDDRLRDLSGLDAKKLGVTLTKQYVPDFHEIIEAATFYKIEQNEKLKALFISSDLPFDYYYTFGPGDVQIRPRGWKWMVEVVTNVRTMMKSGERPPNIDYDHLVNND
jgi:hypothetical protein